MASRHAGDLALRVSRSLELAGRVVDALLVRAPAIDLAAMEAPQDKVLAETALLVRAAATLPDDRAPGVAARAHELAALLRPHASSTRIKAGIALHPSLALDYALAHRCLSTIGHPDAEVEALLQKSIHAPNARGRERLPHRELEQAWIHHLADGRLADASSASTALGRGLDVLTASRDDVYALTHAVLYASDLGMQQPALARPLASVCGEAESLLAGALDDDDFDLAGELLMLWPMLGAEPGATAAFGFDLLCAIEDDVGMLPSLAVDATGLGAESGVAREETALAMTYHTAYVMGLLCVSILRRGPWGGAGEARQRRPALSSVVIAALERLPRASQWEGRFYRLPESTREELAPMVLDVVLRRAIRQFQLGTACELVLAAARDDCWTCAAAQAAGLLERISSLQEGRAADLPGTLAAAV